MIDLVLDMTVVGLDRAANVFADIADRLEAAANAIDWRHQLERAVEAEHEWPSDLREQAARFIDEGKREHSGQRVITAGSALPRDPSNAAEPWWKGLAATTLSVTGRNGTEGEAG